MRLFQIDYVEQDNNSFIQAIYEESLDEALGKFRIEHPVSRIRCIHMFNKNHTYISSYRYEISEEEFEEEVSKIQPKRFFKKTFPYQGDNTDTIDSNGTTTSVSTNSATGIFILVVFLCVLLYGCIAGMKPSDTDAFVMSEEMVKEYLKYPDEADFASITDTGVSIIEEEEDTYTVSSYVISKNGFGVKKRVYYTVTLRYDGNDEWSLIDIDMNE